MIYRMRKNVKVHVFWDKYGDIIPQKIFWSNTFFYVDKIISCKKSYSAQTGGFGLCFEVKITCAKNICSGITKLFFERMPLQKNGIIVDTNTETLSQLFHFYDKFNIRNNIDAVLEFNNFGSIKPIKIWIDDSAYNVKFFNGIFLSTCKNSNDGLRFLCEITNIDLNVVRKPFVLYFDKCPQKEMWFVEEKIKLK